jgi:hypothetical protein
MTSGAQSNKAAARDRPSSRRRRHFRDAARHVDAEPVAQMVERSSLPRQRMISRQARYASAIASTMAGRRSWLFLRTGTPLLDSLSLRRGPSHLSQEGVDCPGVVVWR